MNRIWLRGSALAAGSALLAGCQFGGLNSLSMPGTAGHGSGAYSITVEMPDVATLPQNSPVMVDDVTVGSVAGIQAEQRSDGSFYAAVKLALDKNVVLPANSTATVAQTSLLGSHAHRPGAPEGQAGDRQADRRVEDRRVQHRPLSHHRRGVFGPRCRGQQGQCRCVGRDHRRDLPGRRGPAKPVRRPGPQAGGVDRRDSTGRSTTSSMRSTA